MKSLSVLLSILAMGLWVGCSTNNNPSAPSNSPSSNPTPTATVASSPSTPTVTSTPVCSIATLGYTGSGLPQGPVNANVIVASRFVLAAAGSPATINVYSSGPGPPSYAYGGSQMGVYSDGGSQPQSLLAITSFYGLRSGWNAVPLSPVTLLPGTYWLAFESSANVNLAFATGSAGDEWDVPYSYASLPGVIPGGGSSSTNQYAIYTQFCMTTPPPTFTPTADTTFTATSTPSQTETPVFTDTPTDTATPTPTFTPSDTPTSTPTATSTP